MNQVQQSTTCFRDLIKLQGLSIVDGTDVHIAAEIAISSFLSFSALGFNGHRTICVHACTSRMLLHFGSVETLMKTCFIFLSLKISIYLSNLKNMSALLRVLWGFVLAIRCFNLFILHAHECLGVSPSHTHTLFSVPLSHTHTPISIIFASVHVTKNDRVLVLQCHGADFSYFQL